MINFKQSMKTIANGFKAHQSGIMTGTGVCVMILGAASAVVATVQTMKSAAEVKQEKLSEIAATPEEFDNLSDEDKDKYDDICNTPMTTKEMAPIVWKYWMAPVFLEILGGILIVGAQKKSFDKIAALTAALGYKITEVDDVKDAIKDVVGEEKAEEINRRIDERESKKPIDDSDLANVYDTGTGNQLYKDYYSKRWIKGAPWFIKESVVRLNDKIVSTWKKGDENYVILNEWYYILGLEGTGLGEEFGFDVNKDDHCVDLCSFVGDVSVTEEGYSYQILRFRNGPDYISDGAFS